MKRYLAADGWAPYGLFGRGGKLADLDEWLRERFHRHRGNADVVRQELLEELSIDTSLRTGGAVPAGASGGGEGDTAVRDAARAAVANRFWRVGGSDRRRAVEGALSACFLPVSCRLPTGCHALHYTALD